MATNMWDMHRMHTTVIFISSFMKTLIHEPHLLFHNNTGHASLTATNAKPHDITHCHQCNSSYHSLPSLHNPA